MPLPRPKPKPKPKPAVGSSQGASSTKLAPKNETDFFKLAVPSTSKTNKSTKAEKARVFEISSDDDDVGDFDPKRKTSADDAGVHAKIKTRPAWTQDLNAYRKEIRRSESVAETLPSAEFGHTSEEDLSPRSKRVREAAREDERGRRKKRCSRSPSLTPPPSRARSEQVVLQQAVRSHFVAPELPRIPSPEPLYDTSFETSTAQLAPELRERARRIKAAPKVAQPASSGKPQEVMLKVTWRYHPEVESTSPPKKWPIKTTRDKGLKGVFEFVAREMGYEPKRVRVLYEGDEVFRSATLNAFESIWDEAHFEACLDTTLQHIKRARIQSPRKPRQSEVQLPAAGSASQHTAAGQSTYAQESEQEESHDDKLKLSLQGSGGNKKISVTTRKTTTALALVKHYLKTIDMEKTDAQIKSQRIRLQFEGDDIAYDETVGKIADGELEGGECLEIVGL